MAKRTLPSQDYLRQCFDYDPETGVLTWRERPKEHFKNKQAWSAWTTKFAGRQIGCPNGKGYLVVGLNGKNWLVHRVVWVICCGQPIDEIDHINNDRSDNRVFNLRACSSQQNKWNAPSRRTSATGLKGVSRNSKTGWQARISIGGKTRCLGTYHSPEQAHAAYLTAAAALHGEYSYDWTRADVL